MVGSVHVVLGCERIVIAGNIGVLAVRLMPYQLLSMPCAKYAVTGCYLVVWPPVWLDVNWLETRCSDDGLEGPRGTS